MLVAKVVNRSDAIADFKTLSCRWGVERTFGCSIRQ